MEFIFSKAVSTKQKGVDESVYHTSFYLLWDRNFCRQHVEASVINRFTDSRLLTS